MLIFAKAPRQIRQYAMLFCTGDIQECRLHNFCFDLRTPRAFIANKKYSTDGKGFVESFDTFSHLQIWQKSDVWAWRLIINSYQWTFHVPSLVRFFHQKTKLKSRLKFMILQFRPAARGKWKRFLWVISETRNAHGLMINEDHIFHSIVKENHKKVERKGDL